MLRIRIAASSRRVLCYSVDDGQVERWGRKRSLNFPPSRTFRRYSSVFGSVTPSNSVASCGKRRSSHFIDSVPSTRRPCHTTGRPRPCSELLMRHRQKEPIGSVASFATRPLSQETRSTFANRSHGPPRAKSIRYVSVLRSQWLSWPTRRLAMLRFCVAARCQANRFNVVAQPTRWLCGGGIRFVIFALMLQSRQDGCRCFLHSRFKFDRFAGAATASSNLPCLDMPAEVQDALGASGASSTHGLARVWTASSIRPCCIRASLRQQNAPALLGLISMDLR